MILKILIIISVIIAISSLNVRIQHLEDEIHYTSYLIEPKKYNNLEDEISYCQILQWLTFFTLLAYVLFEKGGNNI